MLISTVQITDPEKKNELIIYARSLGCKAVFCEEYKGMSIQSNDRKTTKQIKQKMKELENN